MYLISHQLLNNNTITMKQYHFLYNKMKENKNFLIIGSLGQGKSTILYLLMDLLDNHTKKHIHDEYLELFNKREEYNNYIKFDNVNIITDNDVLIHDKIESYKYDNIKNFKQVLMTLFGHNKQDALKRYLIDTFKLDKNRKINDKERFDYYSDFIENFDYIIFVSKNQKGDYIVKIYEPLIVIEENNIYFELLTF